jgi:hypothetical protein
MSVIGHKFLHGPGGETLEKLQRWVELYEVLPADLMYLQLDLMYIL